MLRRIFRSLRARSFRTNVSDWYCRDLAATADDPGPLPEGTAFEVLCGTAREPMEQWLFSHRKTYPWVYFPGEIDSARLHGHWYPVLWMDGEIVAFVKLGHTRVFVHDFETEIAFPAGVAFIYDTFVTPELRGRGVATMLLGLVCRWLSGQGYEKVLCHIESWNQASVRAFTNAGFREIGTVRYVRATFCRWWIVSGSPCGRHGLYEWMKRDTKSTSGPAHEPPQT